MSSEEYVFRLVQPSASLLFWAGIAFLAVAWSLLLTRLLPLGVQALAQRKHGLAAAALSLSLCPLVLWPSVSSRLYEEFLTVQVTSGEVVLHSLTGTRRLSLDRPLHFSHGSREVFVSDGSGRIVLPAGRMWRLEHPFYSTDELVAEIRVRSLAHRHSTERPLR